MPQPRPADATTPPVQEAVRFAVVYANVYADTTTGELEIGARCYRTPAAADERRRNHPCRRGLTFVGVFPVSAAVPDSVRQSALARFASVTNGVAETPAGEEQEAGSTEADDALSGDHDEENDQH